ncbi:MAG: alpha/beta hydrolase [Candidatus Nanopelagicales bacterium]
MKKNFFVLFLSVFLLTSCSTQTNTQTQVELPEIKNELEKFYSQELNWTKCEDEKFDCTTIEAPVDYENPTGATLTLSLKKLPAKKDKIGTLLINPGGPGGSGTDFVTYAEDAFGKRLMDSFDILGFDPRGVAESTPLDCLTDKEVDEFIAFDGTPDNEAELTESLNLSKNMAEGCQKIANNLIAHIGTQDAARDMDVIRQLVKDPKLNYLGASYGTYLGATYAELFPDKVGRLVLDGAVDPLLTGEELSFDQAVGLDQALARFVEDCPKHKDCPLTKTGKEGIKEIRDFLDSLDEKPLPTQDPNRVLTQSMGVYAVAGFLYNNDWWEYMRQSLKSAFENDGTDLLLIVDLFNDRLEDGTFATNSTEAIYAINCFDTPSSKTVEEVKVLATEWVKSAPVFGDYLAWGNLACSVWPVKDEKPLTSYKAKSAAPILIIGTKYDPATPYKWAIGLSNEIENNKLITFEGDGHTAYMRGSECVDKYVEDYLVEGTIPTKNESCPAIVK